MLLAALKLWHLLAERFLNIAALPLDHTYRFLGSKLSGNEVVIERVALSSHTRRR